jgi:hypothetical protein
MNWFDILKILGTKSGYAQLDFDNIVEEEETDCKKRWQELCNKVEELDDVLDERFDNLLSVKDLEMDATTFYGDENDGDLVNRTGLIHLYYTFDDSVPEEVYCRALELLDSGVSKQEEMGDYRISAYRKDVGTHKLIGVIISDAPSTTKDFATVGWFHKRKDKYPEHIRILEGGFP